MGRLSVSQRLRKSKSPEVKQKITLDWAAEFVLGLKVKINCRFSWYGGNGMKMVKLFLLKFCL